MLRGFLDQSGYVTHERLEQVEQIQVKFACGFFLRTSLHEYAVSDALKAQHIRRYRSYCLVILDQSVQNQVCSFLAMELQNFLAVLDVLELLLSLQALQILKGELFFFEFA